MPSSGMVYCGYTEVPTAGTSYAGMHPRYVMWWHVVLGAVEHIMLVAYPISTSATLPHEVHSMGSVYA